MAKRKLSLKFTTLEAAMRNATERTKLETAKLIFDALEKHLVRPEILRDSIDAISTQMNVHESAEVAWEGKIILDEDYNALKQKFLKAST